MLGFHCDEPLLLAARLLIEKEQYGQVSVILDAVWPEAARTGRVLSQIETLVVHAILNARRGRVSEAVASMQRALELAAPARCIRLFVNEGAALQPLVERAASAIPHRDFATHVLAAFDPRPPLRMASGDRLSERELEVLGLVASGASNQEAGRKLFVAPSTIKKHLENIYAKLAVNGRVEAIARAREMKLL